MKGIINRIVRTQAVCTIQDIGYLHICNKIRFVVESVYKIFIFFIVIIMRRKVMPTANISTKALTTTKRNEANAVLMTVSLGVPDLHGPTHLNTSN